MNKNISVNKYVHKIPIRKLFWVSIILLLIVAGYTYWQGISNFKGQISIIIDNRLNLLKYQIFNEKNTFRPSNEKLEQFHEIAETLYQNIVNLPLDQLRIELNQITTHYFHSCLEDIMY